MFVQYSLFMTAKIQQCAGKSARRIIFMICSYSSSFSSFPLSFLPPSLLPKMTAMNRVCKTIMMIYAHFLLWCQIPLLPHFKDFPLLVYSYSDNRFVIIHTQQSHLLMNYYKMRVRQSCSGCFWNCGFFLLYLHIYLPTNLAAACLN